MRQNSHSNNLLTLAEAAERAHLSTSRIRDLAVCGDVESVRTARRIYVSAHSLHELMIRRAKRKRRPRLRLVVDNTPN